MFLCQSAISQSPDGFLFCNDLARYTRQFRTHRVLILENLFLSKARWKMLRKLLREDLSWKLPRKWLQLSSTQVNMRHFSDKQQSSNENQPEMYRKSIETHLASAGCAVSDPSTGAVILPLHLSTTFERSKETLQLDKGFNYSRLGNPTRKQLEEFVCKLEKGRESFAFSSGMQAAMAVLTCLPNSFVLLPDDLYHGVYVVLVEIFSKWNVKYEKVDMTDHKAVKEKLDFIATKNQEFSNVLVWVETPSNPMCKVADIQKINELLTHAIPQEKALLLVDATWSTPYLTKPLILGADIVLQSSTKYLNGHCDSTGGVLTVGTSPRAESVLEMIKIVHQVGGGVLSPFDCWLTLRGLRTLAVRMKAHCENAMAVAEYLQGHSAVEKVYYPGLVTHPQNKLARVQMSGKFGGMVSFQVKRGKSSQSLEGTALKVLKLICAFHSKH